MAKRSLIILVFTIKALIIIPALSACSACLVTYTRMRKNRGLDSSFPCRVSQRAVRVSAGQCHSTGRPGLKLAEPWREAGNLLTRLASRAERCSERGINKKPSRAFQQAHQGLWEARPAGSLGEPEQQRARLTQALIFIAPSQQLPLQAINTTSKRASPSLNATYLPTSCSIILKPLTGFLKYSISGISNYKASTFRWGGGETGLWKHTRTE